MQYRVFYYRVKIPYQLILTSQFHEHIQKQPFADIFLKIYKEASLFAHSIKGLKVNLLNIHHTAGIFFFLIRHVGKTSRLMYKKSNSFVYIFAVSCQFFPNNSGRVCPIKLKIGMLYHISNVIRLTFFRYLSQRLKGLLFLTIKAPSQMFFWVIYTPLKILKFPN